MSKYELRWQDPAWSDQVQQWIKAQTARQGMRITGEIDQPHALPWSTVLRVPTDQGILFFKATAEESLFEVALTEQLAQWFPDRLPELVAADRAAGWMLMRHGGEPLRTTIRATKAIHHWTPALTLYVDLQASVANRASNLIALGVPDWRLARLPDLFAALLEDRDSMLLGQPKGLNAEEHGIVAQLGPRLRQIFDRLAAYGIPETINQGDFHDANVLVRGDRITLFDWGDGSVTHPFVSLRTFFVSIEIALDLEDYAFTPEMDELLGRYLTGWQQIAPVADLRAAYQLSKPVATVVSALAWHRTVRRLEGPQREKYSHVIPELLRELIYHDKMLRDADRQGELHD